MNTHQISDEEMYKLFDYLSEKNPEVADKLKQAKGVIQYKNEVLEDLRATNITLESLITREHMREHESKLIKLQPGLFQGVMG